MKPICSFQNMAWLLFRELIYEGLMNFQQDEIAKNPEAGLASPTVYADLHINDYASIPELGYTDWIPSSLPLLRNMQANG